MSDQRNGGIAKIEPTTLAYLAGMIDGDGFISINRSTRKGVQYFGACIGIAGTRKEPHELAASLWGGKVARYFPKNPNHRPQYQWSRMGKRATVIIEQILPYLLIKNHQALLALELSEHINEMKSENSFPWFCSDYDPIQMMNVMKDEMIDLNQSRNRSGKKAAGRLLDGELHDGYPRAKQ